MTARSVFFQIPLGSPQARVPACADSSESPSAPSGPRFSRTPPRIQPTRTLNIGTLAHVDAGRTSLTERLLFDHGAVERLGSVDAGDTRTDDGGIERGRGITIRSAVACFTVGGTRVNLIDTPGHSNFVAEVERALKVLDGAVLLLSAVVRARTRVLMRTLRRLRLPGLTRGEAVWSSRPAADHPLRPRH